jgi:branched-chain amino acid transport system permease protein
MKWIKNKSEIIFIPLLFGILYLLQTTGILNGYIMQVLLLVGINIMMTQSLNLITGLAGQPSLGHAGFMSIGAYSAASITTIFFNVTAMAPALQIVFFLVATAFGGICAALFGLLIGIPTLRLKGDYLAIVTLGFGELIRSIIRIVPAIGGARGLTGIPKLAGLFWIFLFAVITIYVCRNFMDSLYGRSAIAIRENNIAADTMGINVSRYKVITFVLSAFIAGVAGSLYAHTIQFVQPDIFSSIKSTEFLVYLYAGGVGSISGSILGAFMLTILPELLRFLSTWRLVIYGVLLVCVILFRPLGLFGGREFAFLKLNTGGIRNVGFRSFRRKNKDNAAEKPVDKEAE